ncbi:TIGR02391 family protein [Streptomyces sp. NPDC051576]|uniref:TIGR02391 family protein n=1 Tax=Streptomyces sp. NPDC051576 TaxID=3155803 RepID=UPI00343E2A74
MLLNAIWKWFKAENEWPTLDQIDRELYRREGDASFVENALKEIPKGLVWGIDLVRLSSTSFTQPVQLTLAGVANCDNSAAEVNAFLGLVRLGAGIERDWEPSKSQDAPHQPYLDPEVLKDHAIFDPNLLPTPEVLYRAAPLALNEPWSSGMGFNPADFYWRLSFDRRIRPFAGVQDLADYWQRRARVLAPAPTADHVAALAGVATVDATAFDAVAEVVGTVASMLTGLHADVDSKSGALFRDGYIKQAVFEMCKHVEHRVQTLADPKSSGKGLMGRVFNLKSPLLDPTMATDDFSRQDEQEGFQYLFMGMMQAVRNMGGHGNYPVYSEEEAFEILAFLSFLSRRLDIAQQRLQISDGETNDSGS